LVEVSPALSEIQEKALTGRSLNNHQNQEERQENVADEKSQNSEVQNTTFFVKEELTTMNCTMF